MSWAVSLEPMTASHSGRPAPDEFAPYAREDIAVVEGSDAAHTLQIQGAMVAEFLATLSDQGVAGKRYAPDKWTPKEILGHLIDDERIFVYRMLTVARGDPLALPGFDQNRYVTHAGFEIRDWADLLEEYRLTRQGTVAFLQGLPAASWLRRGTVNGYPASVRGLAFHVAGHELHHLRIIRERYLPLLLTIEPA